jgi:hypothetical protein
MSSSGIERRRAQRLRTRWLQAVDLECFDDSEPVHPVRTYFRSTDKKSWTAKAPLRLRRRRAQVNDID